MCALHSPAEGGGLESGAHRCRASVPCAVTAVGRSRVGHARPCIDVRCPSSSSDVRLRSAVSLLVFPTLTHPSSPCVWDACRTSPTHPIPSHSIPFHPASPSPLPTRHARPSSSPCPPLLRAHSRTTFPRRRRAPIRSHCRAYRTLSHCRSTCSRQSRHRRCPFLSARPPLLCPPFCRCLCLLRMRRLRPR